MLKSPVVYEHLNNGGMSVQLGTANTFVRVPGFVVFDLILYVPSILFQLYRDRSSWVEPVLS